MDVSALWFIPTDRPEDVFELAVELLAALVVAEELLLVFVLPLGCLSRVCLRWLLFLIFLLVFFLPFLLLDPPLDTLEPKKVYNAK